MDLVEVDKRVLSFVLSPPEDGLVHDTLTVTNIADIPLAFKVKTTNQHRYIVRPNVGKLEPSKSVDIFIGMQPPPRLADNPIAGPSKDKFLLRVTDAPPDEYELPDGFWAGKEDDPTVIGIKFRVEFMDPVIPGENLEPIRPIRPLPDVRTPTAVPHARDMPPSMLTSDTKKGQVANVELNDAEALLQQGNYEHAMQRVKDLQEMLDSKNLELARLKTELAETKAESERVLKEAPKTPLSANKLLSDPFGGVSLTGFGLMLLLFLIIVNIILNVVKF